MKKYPCRGMAGENLKQRLTEAAALAGALKTGFAAAAEVDERETARFARWIERGDHGGMTYMERHTGLRHDPRLLADNPSEARTVMVCAFPYFHPEQQCGDAIFALYARGDDYHEVLRRRLLSVAQLLESEGFTARICVDTAPVLERYWAVKGGIGFIGRNRQLIVPGMGSYVFLAEIITSASIEPDAPCTLTCGDCGRCVSACPGGALEAPGGFDARRCLSYLTIEHRGALPTEAPSASRGNRPRTMAEALDRRVYGCDECQRVCPHNARPAITGIEEFRMRPALRHITRAGILAMTQQQFSAVFSHSAVKRTKLAGLQRNAAAISPAPPHEGVEPQNNPLSDEP